MDEFKLNKGYAHESLDRTYVVMDMFEEYVAKHPFVGQTPELSRQAQEIIDRLFDLYQSIGREGDKYENIS